MSGNGAVTFFWDFHGPRAEGTARHFLRHLDEFLLREGVGGCSTGVDAARPFGGSSGGGGQWTVACRAPAEAADSVRRALRPRREREEP